MKVRDGVLFFFVTIFLLLQYFGEVQGKRRRHHSKSESSEVNSFDFDSVPEGNLQEKPKDIVVTYNGSEVCQVEGKNRNLWIGLLKANLRTLETRIRRGMRKNDRNNPKWRKRKHTSTESDENSSSLEKEEYNLYDKYVREDIVGLLNEQKQLYNTLLKEVEATPNFQLKKNKMDSMGDEMEKQDRATRKYIKQISNLDKKVQLYRTLECEGKVNQLLYKSFSKNIHKKYGEMLRGLEKSAEQDSMNKVSRETNRMINQNDKDIEKMVRARKKAENEKKNLEKKLRKYLNRNKSMKHDSMNYEKKLREEMKNLLKQNEENEMKLKEIAKKLKTLEEKNSMPKTTLQPGKSESDRDASTIKEKLNEIPQAVENGINEKLKGEKEEPKIIPQQ
ncbi:hypothetical protein RUM44_001516 [Polyplax serrata]|uniref:Uncharacterized protein n=1 Tax=Polyplax serrata TaxID=468196 RepID=A0ABR1AKH2_POLSC